MTLRKLLLASITTSVLGAGAAMAEEIKVGIAAEPYPPFASTDASGNWVGWEVEIIDAVCAAAELECVITPVPWDGIIPSLTGNQIDTIMASMSIIEVRQQTIDFSNPYYNTPTVVVAERSSDILPTPMSLTGKFVGVQASTISQAYAEAYFGGAAEIRVFQTQDDANQDLVAGRIDATVADSIAMSEFIEVQGAACCEIKGQVAADESILGRGIGAGVRKGDDALRESLNAGIASILANGVHAEITSRYFSTSIYGE